MVKKAKTPDAVAFHQVVAHMPCVLCARLHFDQTSPTTVHHMSEGAGMAQRAGHFMVAALCRECHQGKHGIHGDKARLRNAKTTEADLIDTTTAQAFAMMREVL